MSFPQPETKAVRILGVVVALALGVAFFVWSQAYFEPLHVGVDQNGYLVGGKQVSRTLLPRQTPVLPAAPGQPAAFDRHAFIANMWVTAANDKASFDPKYPIGLPLLYALTIWLTAGGTTAAFYVSPIAMALALPGVFVVVRRFAGTYGGLLAVMAFAVSPAIDYRVNDPGSHAVSVCCATWGMAAALRWWFDGGKRWAVIGGLLVGYCATVRYSEGLLVLPLLWTAVFRAPTRLSSVVHGVSEEIIPTDDTPHTTNAFASSRLGRLKSRWLGPLLLLVAWFIPVALLAGYNLFFLGTLTGYDATNESTGFSWAYFLDNWETALRDIGTLGLFFLLPLAVLGGVVMVWRDWRRAGFIWLWAGPCLTLYSFYYWAPDGLGYLRFFLTTWPPLLAAAMWVMLSGHRSPARSAGLFVRLARPVWAIAAAALIGVALFYAVRYDRETKTITPLQTYLEKPASAYQKLGGRAALFGGVVSAAMLAGALAATTRRTVGAVAAGAVTLLSVASSASTAVGKSEQDAYEAQMWQASLQAVQQAVPDGAMVVCPDESLLQALQFVSDDRLYTGLSFDRGWVDGRPRAASDDPVLIDPVRGQQLFDALKGFDQNALNDQARRLVRSTLDSKRRVFVVQAVPPGEPANLLRSVRQAQDNIVTTDVVQTFAAAMQVNPDEVDKFLRAPRVRPDGTVAVAELRRFAGTMKVKPDEVEKLLRDQRARLDAAMPTDEVRRFAKVMRTKPDGIPPTFVQRFILRPNEAKPSLVARRVAWWTVPQINKDTWPVAPRGRRPVQRPSFRTLYFQIWEVTSG